ncbi:MAG: hypothetical protein GWN85_27270, partial [Gemmatimonadetes bacterium]|nr:hypothetical protein [Gemmatimonadota bacterium]NIR39135.1 hypothetical protein [Actinomycetota bacterium]NIT87199.1 hypothetical protein [Gemmatimonadota bacterium]NIX22904.1 hypothetical protein [Actinomycetota bacterium]
MRARDLQASAPVAAVVAMASFALAEGLVAQNAVDLDAVATWLGPDVAPGYETRLTPGIAAEIP